MNTSTLALATHIASLDLEDLRELAASRRIASPDSVSDPLGLALEFMKPDSIARALRTTPRVVLEALTEQPDQHTLSPEMRNDLLRAGLVGVSADDQTLVWLPEVGQLLLQHTLPRMQTSAEAPTNVDTSAWFVQGLTSVRRTAELVRKLSRRPLRLGRRNTVTLAVLRELAHECHLEAADVEHLIEAMQTAGLLARVQSDGSSHLLVTTHAALDWLELDYPLRWVSLSSAVIATLNHRLLPDLEASGYHLGWVLDQLPFTYPLLPETDVAELNALLGFFERLGLTVDGQLTPAAIWLLRNDPDAATESAKTDFPPAVPGVYLQPDLSVIVPGPLAPEDETALSIFAHSEQLSVAATLRITQATLDRAVLAGYGVPNIRTLLERLSLTGIPQPLDFMLSETERRVSAITAGSPEQARAQAPRLTESQRDASRPPRGDRLQPDGLTGQQLTSTPREIPSEIDEMIKRVFVAAQGNGGNLSRKLELAIRHKSPVHVTAVAGTDERVFTLLPVSLRDGRLRATDQRAGVERTLPLSAITAVEAASARE